MRDAALHVGACMEKYVLSFSYGDYLAANGGTDKVILEHQRMFNEIGVSYLYFCPVRFTYRLPFPANSFWLMILDGKRQSMLHTSEVISYLKEITLDGGECIGLFIHHLLGLNLPGVKEIVGAYTGSVYVYIHDYYNICTAYNLVKPGTNELCEGELCEEKCGDCPALANSLKLHTEIIGIFNVVDKERLFFICPSSVAQQHIRHSLPAYSGNTMVIPHQKLNGGFDGNKKAEFPLKIAFIGSTTELKGWKEFCRLAALYSGEAYRFFYFGVFPVHENMITAVPVHFRDCRSAMTQALRENEIDCVFLWSKCHETYSYTYYEALSANCYIITNKDSGNIHYQVRQRGSGVVTDDAGLDALFSSPADFKMLVSEYKSSCCGIPDTLEENDEIVQKTLEAASKCVGTFNFSGAVRTNLLQHAAGSIYYMAYRIKMNMKKT